MLMQTLLVCTTMKKLKIHIVLSPELDSLSLLVVVQFFGVVSFKRKLQSLPWKLSTLHAVNLVMISCF